MQPIKLIPLRNGRMEQWSNGAENNAVALTYDMSAVLAIWPDAVPSVAFERADGVKYAHACERDGAMLRIPLTTADTAVHGTCKCVVTMTNADGTANSVVFYGVVTQGIDSLCDTPDAPSAGIIEQCNDAARRAELAAERAESAGDGTGGGTVEVDATLTQEGMAADAKAVGDAVGKLSEEIEEINATIGGAGKTETVNYEFTENDIVDGAFIGGNPAYESYGKEAPTETYVCTRMLPADFDEGKSLTVRCTIYGNAALAFYDGGGNVLNIISGINASQYGLTATDGMETYVVTPPDGTKYIRMSGQKTAGGSGDVYTKPSDFSLTGERTSGGAGNAEELETRFNSNITDIASKKVLVIGDSISADYYADYPKWVTHLTDIGFFGLDNITNDSVHDTGFVARYNNAANDFISRLAAVTDPESYDMVIIFGGINDYIKDIPMGESGGDKMTSFKPAVDDFFATLTERFVGARIAVMTPLRTRYYNDANKAGHKQPDYAEYIKSVAQTYALPVLDLMNHSGFHPEHDTFRQRWTYKNWSGGDGKQGDGTHPIEEYERKHLAPMIRHFLQGLL